MARGVAVGRIVFGLGFMTMPGWTGKVWIGPDAGRSPVKLLTQAIGARDLTMGLGALIAMRRGKPARGWMEAISLTDVLDFTCALLAKDVLPATPRAAVLVLAGGSAAQAAYASTGVDD
jgi:hypothetical protein